MLRLDRWRLPVVKKRAFFLTSLPLAMAALAAQATAFYFVLLAIGEATGRVMLTMPPFIFFPHAQPVPTEGPGHITSLLLLGGLVLAVLGSMSVIASFRRGEPGWGWRIIPITLLALYVGTWLVLLHA
jgi:hypothetical protein